MKFNLSFLFLFLLQSSFATGAIKSATPSGISGQNPSVAISIPMQRAENYVYIKKMRKFLGSQNHAAPGREIFDFDAIKNSLSREFGNMDR